MSEQFPRFHGGRRLIAVAAALALIGAAALIAGAFVDRDRLFFSYLAAYAYAVSTALGALIFLMSCHAMRATWPVALRRLTEAITGTLPLYLVLFVPIALGLDRLYRGWLHPELIEDEHARALVLHKLSYLNATSFLARTGAYFAVWITCEALLRRRSVQGDTDRARAASPLPQALSAGALPLVALALSFASFDWLMSLVPTWFSTMFPIYVFAGGFVAAIALLTVLSFASQRAGLLPGLTGSHYYALGRLLLAFIIFWGYAAYFQFFLQWIGNLPEEVEFYLQRVRGPWAAVSWVLVVAQFVAPFLVLLSYRLKRRPALLTAVAGWILAAHYIDVHWLVVPSAPDSRAPYHWLDLAALLAIGGASVAFAALRMRGKPMAPINDPALSAALRYESV